MAFEAWDKAFDEAWDKVFDDKVAEKIQPAVRPVGYKLLVRPIKPQEKTRGGIILAQETTQHIEYVTCVGEVVAMGADCYQHSKFNGHQWCRVGDVVSYGKHAGQTIHINEENETVVYRFLNDDEVIAVVSDLSRVKVYV